MPTPYFCTNERRRQAVQAHATLNGIDFLEVLDQDTPPGEPRQQTLFVRCLKDAPTGMARTNVRVEGGVRITPVETSWVGRADEALIPAALASLIPAADQPLTLVVRTEAAGDFSPYRLCLVNADGSAPLTGFDPVLAQVDFSFKVECPSDFDCETETVCPPEPVSLPPIDYLSKDYASFRRLMLDRLSVVMPAWTERSPADVGVALVEVLAYAADQLSYYQDAVATEAYLGTARRRPSVRRHARLLDYPMHEGCNARTWVCFEVEADGLTLTGGGWHLETTPDATPVRLLTRLPDAGVALAEADFDQTVQTHQPDVFELMHDLTLYVAHNCLKFYTWGDQDCCLARRSTRATLIGHFPDLAVGQVLVFEAVRGTDTGQHADADPSHRHAVRLTALTPTEDPLGGRFLDPATDDPVAITEIAWAVEDALPFPLCLSKTINGEYIEDMAWAWGNVALADHGQTISDEVLADPTGDRFYRPALDEDDLTHCEAYTASLAAAAALTQDPRKALPALRLTDTDGQTWHPRRDLLDSSAFDRHVVAEVENDSTVRLRFGDDTYGQSPPALLRDGTEPEDYGWKATYRIGNGTPGNIGSAGTLVLQPDGHYRPDARALAHVVLNTNGITHVWNPLPAQGGIDAESMEEVRRYAPQAFRTQERAVTEADYAAVAERHPDVQKAVATRRWTGSWHTMFLTIDRTDGQAVDAAFEEELRAWVEGFALAGHDVEIDAPRYVPLDIALHVCVQTGYFQSNVRAALLDTFSNRQLSSNHRGYFHPDEWTFGEPVYLNPLIATAMQVPGVQYVEVLRFQRWGQDPNNEIDDGLVEMGRLEIALLDNDPNAPENGRLTLTLEGGF
jgi:hypothetical protein